MLASNVCVLDCSLYLWAGPRFLSHLFLWCAVPSLNHRAALWHDLSQRLGRLSDDALMAWRDATAPAEGWGAHRVLSLDGVPVFAKSLVVTERELEDPLGTRNVHGLPLVYSYGMGSAGFRAGRELALHNKATQWVLEGACPHFPLTYHHRLLPAGPRASRLSPEAIDAQVASWNGAESVRQLLEARNAATHELFLVMEFVPHVLRSWFGDRPDAAPRFIEQMISTGRFLAEQGVVHFDAHAGNILTDGTDFFLTDFGLGMDQAFELRPEEEAFRARHTHYDRGMLACGPLWPLAGAVKALSDDAREVLAARAGGTQTSALVPCIRELVDEGLLELPPEFVDVLEAHSGVVPHVTAFFDAIQGPEKAARFPDEAVAAALPA